MNRRYLAAAPAAANRQLVEGLLAGLEPCAPPAEAPASPPPAPTVTAPSQVAPPAIVAPAPRPAATKKRPLYRRWWPWTLGAVVTTLATVPIVITSVENDGRGNAYPRATTIITLMAP